MSTNIQTGEDTYLSVRLEMTGETVLNVFSTNVVASDRKERLERDATVEGTADRLNTTERSQEREVQSDE